MLYSAFNTITIRVFARGKLKKEFNAIWMKIGDRFALLRWIVLLLSIELQCQ